MRNRFSLTLVAGLLGAVLSASVPAKAQMLYDANLDFSTTNQNMWGSGSALTYDYYQQFGPSWNQSGSIGGISNNVGLEVSGSTSGQVGMYLSVHADSGSVNVDYPVQVQLDYSKPVGWKPGDPIQVTSSYVLQPQGASISTASPNGHVSIGTFVNMSANVNATVGYVVGTASGNIINTSVNQSADLFSLTSQVSKTVSDPAGILSATGQVPYVTTQGNASNAGATLTSSGQDSFFNVTGDITNALTAALGAPHLLNNDWSSGPFSGSYHLLDAYASVDFNATQSFSFAPQLMMQLVGSNGQVFDVPVGQAVDFTLPANVTSLHVTPTFYLDDTFTNDTGISVTPSINFTPLDASIGAFGYNLDFNPFGTLSWSPGSYSLGNIYDNSWELGGFQNYTTDSFTVSYGSEGTSSPTVPEPGVSSILMTGLLAGSLLLRGRRSKG
jgi:hypothetical protein